MRVLHLSTSDIRGGAARGAYWLHRALCDMNIDSMMLVGRKYSDDDRVVSVSGSMAPAREWLRGMLDGIPLRRYEKTQDAFWTVGWVPRRLAPIIDDLKPDLVHLHWTGAGFLPVDVLRTLPYPLVWTLRDMWAFTGGCHYTAGCRRYQTGCGRCPQLRSDISDDLSHAVWQNKRGNWDGLDLWLVPISNWLADCARRSPLFSTTPIKVIPNGVDGHRFYPVPRDEARAAWDLEPDKRYILFGALGAVHDERKGFHALIEALHELEKHDCAKDAELIVFGDDAPQNDFPARLPVRFVGHISDDERLAQLYAAADVTVVPSLQEAFGKTLIEAMACGTPVVAFRNGGPVDIVTHRETGYLAEPFDPVDLGRGIAWCLQNSDRADMGHKARVRVEETFDAQVVAQCYRKLYRSILSRAP
jgi:glycosyltransferase involved in cell wall biosynthesis